MKIISGIIVFKSNEIREAKNSRFLENCNAGLCNYFTGNNVYFLAVYYIYIVVFYCIFLFLELWDIKSILALTMCQRYVYDWRTKQKYIYTF